MILGVRHAALLARDLSRAIAFYCDALGFQPYHVTGSDWAMLHRAGSSLSLIRVPETAPVRPAPSAGTHPAHVGITVDSREDVLKLHESLLGVLKPLGKAVGKPAEHRDGSFGFYFQDTEGNQLECIFIPHGPMPLRVPEALGAVLVSAHELDSQVKERFQRHLPGWTLELASLATRSLESAIERLMTLERAEPVAPSRIYLLPWSLKDDERLQLQERLRSLEASHGELELVLTPDAARSPEVQEAWVASALSHLEEPSSARR